MSNHYREKKIGYTDDGRLIQFDTGESIMMDWECPMMEFQAKQICMNGGDVLNVGYGLGCTDHAIETCNITSHSIIEIHPDVQSRIMGLGWHKKPHVKLYFGDWRSFLTRLPKLDGVYFDTWDEGSREFFEFLPNILKPNGIATFFNTPKDDHDGDNIIDESIDLIHQYFDVEMTTMEIPFIDSYERQSGSPDRYYWKKEWTTYYSPLLRLKKR